MKNICLSLCLMLFSVFCAFAQHYTITVDASNALGFADSLLYGTNFVHERNVLDEGFKNNVDNLKIQSLRYPGGTVTEHLFELGFKHDQGETGNFSPIDENILTADEQELKEFLDYCKAEKIEPILVIPTKRYVQNNDCDWLNCDSLEVVYTGALTDSISIAASRAAEFVRRVNIAHRYGDHYVKYWEIGNEYYVDGPIVPILSTWRYKRLAVDFADEIHAMDSTIKPLINHSRTDQAAITELAAYFDQSADDNPAEKKGRNVDGVIIHAYSWMPQASVGSISDRLAVADSNIDAVKGTIQYATNAFGLPAYLTEWNINSKGDNFPGGMIGANLLPMLFHNIVESGAVFATQWPMDWRDNGISSRLANRDGALTPSGQIWDWLATYGMERNLVETSISTKQPSSSNIKTMSFASDDELTVLIMCRQGKVDGQVKINIEGFDVAQIISAQRMTRTDPIIKSKLNSAIIRNITPSLNTDLNQLLLHINEESTWEIIRITCSSTVVAPTYDYLENVGSGKRMSSNESDDDVELTSNTNNALTSEWTFVKASSGNYFIVNEGNNMRLRGKDKELGNTESIHLIENTSLGTWVQWEITQIDSAIYIDNIGQNVRLIGTESGISFTDKTDTSDNAKWYIAPFQREEKQVLNIGEKEKLSDEGIRVYPIPATSEITVGGKLDNAYSVSIQLYNVLGALVLSYEDNVLGRNSFESKLNISSLNSGIHFVEVLIVNKDGFSKRYLNRIIKEK